VPRVNADAATPSRRMSYNDYRALEMLPARITSLQARIDVLTSALADPDLYARDAAQFNNTTSALAAARDELMAAEEQWLSLEMLREEIDGA
jgi:ABC transport system ATP-binding/permease protein